MRRRFIAWATSALLLLSLLTPGMVAGAPLEQPASAPSAQLQTTWFFAEGSTAAPFQEWILLANPSAIDNANATLTFFFPDGSSTGRTFVVGERGGRASSSI